MSEKIVLYRGLTLYFSTCSAWKQLPEPVVKTYHQQDAEKYSWNTTGILTYSFEKAKNQNVISQNYDIIVPEIICKGSWCVTVCIFTSCIVFSDELSQSLSQARTAEYQSSQDSDVEGTTPGSRSQSQSQGLSESQGESRVSDTAHEMLVIGKKVTHGKMTAKVFT